MLTKFLPLFLAVTVLAAPSPSWDSADDASWQRPFMTSERQPSTAVLHDTYWGGPSNTCNPSTLRIYKSTSNGGHDLTTMLTFKYPSGQYCWLEFYGPAIPSGSRQVDVYTQWAVVDQCPSSGNNRDRNIGRLEIPEGGGKAKWIATYGNYLVGPGSPCPTPGKIEGIELVGVGDNEDIKWKQAPGKGVRVIYN